MWNKKLKKSVIASKVAAIIEDRIKQGEERYEAGVTAIYDKAHNDTVALAEQIASEIVR